MENNEFMLRFWGARGSHPVPGNSTLQFGGNTPCVEICAAGHTIILDAGTGIIELGRAMARQAAGNPIVATIFFSHMHHDHTQGFPFFAPAYIGTSQLAMFGPSIFERDLEEMLARTMLPPSFPVGLKELPALKSINTIRDTEIISIDPHSGAVTMHNRFLSTIPNSFEEIVVRTLRSYAHPDGVLIYRVEWQGKSVVYATDTEGYVNTDQRLVQFAQGADVLIHDAQYSEAHYLGQLPGSGATQGWGHSTPQMAAAVASAAQVGELILFHHEPRYTDAMIVELEQEAQALFANSRGAFEGLEIDLLAPSKGAEQPEAADTELEHEA